MFIWDAEAATLEFRFEGIYANFVGFPECLGAESGSIVLREVREVLFDIDTKERRQYIHEISVDELADESIATILFRPSGRITAKFRTADFPDISSQAL